jgi:hypothetical protein
VTAAELIGMVTDSGVHLTPDGRHIRWVGVLSQCLYDELARHKAAVLALLRARAGMCSECGAPLGGNGQAVTLALVGTDGTVTCAACLSGLTALRRKGVGI